MMKKIVKLLVIGAIALASNACELFNDEPPVNHEAVELEVTPNNISGSWGLDAWSEGELPEGMFVYIDFVRSDRTFTMYQNIDSHSDYTYTRTLTGRYHIYIDEELGCAVLRGEYDHGAGEWNHRYIVESLTEQSMKLVPKDSPKEWCTYIRTTIPAELLGEQ